MLQPGFRCSTGASFTSTHLHLWGLSNAVLFRPPPLQPFTLWAAVCSWTHLSPEMKQKPPKSAGAWCCEIKSLGWSQREILRHEDKSPAPPKCHCPLEVVPPPLSCLPTQSTRVNNSTATLYWQTFSKVLCSEQHRNKALWSRRTCVLN